MTAVRKLQKQLMNFEQSLTVSVKSTIITSIMNAGSRFNLGPHSVVSGAHLPLSDFPSVVLPNGEARVKRLSYLSQIRNQLLGPLNTPSEHVFHLNSQVNYTSTKFDRILFLNDIYFQPVDALNLLFSTNQNPNTGAADYDVACAADFVSSVIFYDTFVVRDYEGYGMGLTIFPWFTSQGQSLSRHDVLASKDAVRVKSCWGGMAAFKAAPFLTPNMGSKNNINAPISTPLRFRHDSELYWESSECCLLNADIADRTPDAKIFLNPYIRVAYDADSWAWLPFIRRVERVFVLLQYLVSKIGYPEFNPRQLEREGEMSTRTLWVYDDDRFNGERLRNLTKVERKGDLEGKWKDVEELAKPGGFCGQRRLFVMKSELEEANVDSGRLGTGRNWEKGMFPPN